LCISQSETNKKLDAFTVAATATDREVALTLDFGDVTDFDHIDIRRKNGDMPPSVLCNSDDLVFPTITDYTDRVILDPGNTDSINYSYRICIYDSGANLIGTNTAVDVQPFGTVHTIFVTDTYSNGAEVGGLVGADSICQAAAVSATLSGTFKAILSDSINDAISRLPIIGPIFNTHGERVANDSADFWDSSLDSAIRYDQYGATAPTGRSWAGTQTNGTAHSNTCNDWTLTTGIGNTNFSPNYTNSYWLYHSAAQNCTDSYTLMCISQ
jgi:hypothetical protein